MDRQSAEQIANIEDEPTVFVRASRQELEPAELDVVAGGGRSCIVPMG